MPVDPERDHIRGPADAPVTLVEYGDFECPYCGQAEPASASCSPTSATSATSGATCRSPTCTRTPQLAAEAAEAAAAQGEFWEMHDLLLDHQDELRARDLRRLCRASSASTSSASATTCDATRTRRGSPRTSTRADLSGVTGTPTFFVNGRRHYGAYDIETLSAAVSRRRRQSGDRGRIPRPDNDLASIPADPGNLLRYPVSETNYRNWTYS